MEKTDTYAGQSLWQDAWLRLKKNHMAVVSASFLLLIFLLCFIAPILFTFQDPNAQELSNTFAPPGKNHLLGTDQSGRDLLARLIFGGQISLLVGFIATAVSLVIGVAWGGISGYAGGRTDTLMMRTVDVLYGLPFLMLVILFSLLISEHSKGLATIMVADWGVDPETAKKTTNLVPLFIAIGALGWLTMARMARAQVISIKNLEYIEAARSLGLSHSRILLRHILPNMIGPIIVYTTLTVPGFILYEASLSYLGLGVEAPNSSWGILLKDGANYLETHPRLLIIPSILFSLTLFALNFLGDGLRDALDPKAAKD
ncbi:ABC transporter permease [Verrucomicrobiaceae bacterium N1E253]|uniref:Oligopeptide transport system permease protein OppC n=1 Tax=Oceaniferula marina TaxID=2748318 RepID=A0A851GK20_9BACT|nr:ABC transporter permease [Oceaniferula marina]NWK55515.1 ABC transporter permease [Oceaniferula marina]